MTCPLRLHAVRRSMPRTDTNNVWLRYRPPYHWPSMMSYLQARSIPGVEFCDGQVYRRTFILNGTQGVLEVTLGKGNCIRLRVNGLSNAELPRLISRVRRIFDLDADPQRIEATLSQDALMAQLCGARPGLRIPQGWEPFEQAVRTILGQQITVAGAITLAGRLVRRYGDVLRLESASLTHTFPSPQSIAQVDIVGLGMPNSRAKTIETMAEALLSNPHLLLPNQGLQAVITSLCRLKGIGPWSAAYLALRQVGERDAFPLGDVGLIKALRVLEGHDADLPRRSLAWIPLRAYAAQHLWASLSPGPSAK